MLTSFPHRFAPSPGDPSFASRKLSINEGLRFQCPPLPSLNAHSLRPSRNSSMRMRRINPQWVLEYCPVTALTFAAKRSTSTRPHANAMEGVMESREGIMTANLSYSFLLGLFISLLSYRKEATHRTGSSLRLLSPFRLRSNKAGCDLRNDNDKAYGRAIP